MLDVLSLLWANRNTVQYCTNTGLNQNNHRLQCTKYGHVQLKNSCPG